MQKVIALAASFSQESAQYPPTVLTIYPVERKARKSTMPIIFILIYYYLIMLLYYIYYHLESPFYAPEDNTMDQTTRPRRQIKLAIR